MQLSRTLIKNKLYSLISKYQENRNWQDYGNFVDVFSDAVIDNFEANNFDLFDILRKIDIPFLNLNEISEDTYLQESLVTGIFNAWNDHTKYSVPAISFQEIFPEILQFTDEEAGKVRLDLDEKIIQDTIRKAPRSKGATPISRRGKDSAVEVADIEDFAMKVNSRSFTFTVVVKGLGSLSRKKINLEIVGHQLLKAYTTRPDYIILVSTTEPVDHFRTDIVEFGLLVRNRHLVIFAPPVDLAKFLLWQGVSS